MYIAVSNRILLTLQMIPSKNLALKKTTDSLTRKKTLRKFIKIFAQVLVLIFVGIFFLGNFFSRNRPEVFFRRINFREFVFIRENIPSQKFPLLK